MTTSFNPDRRSIPVRVWLFGPIGIARAILTLDTGATRTLIARDIAEKIGYRVDDDAEAVPTITVSGTEDMPLLSLERFDALGQQRHDFPVLCHNLPPGTPTDGLLGLDFFRSQRLTIDFREGLIILD